MSGILVSDLVLRRRLVGPRGSSKVAQFAPWLCSMGVYACQSKKGWEIGSGKDPSTAADSRRIDWLRHYVSGSGLGVHGWNSSIAA
jgi:hypothetical protein